MELWRPAVGFEDSYAVSSLGNVKSLSRPLPFLSKRGNWHVRITNEKPLIATMATTGYLMVSLCREGVRYPATVHSLVAAAFIGPRPKGQEVAHNDGCRTNNAAANLRYATRSDNHADKYKHGTALFGSRVPGAKLTEQTVPKVRSYRGRASAQWVADKFGVTQATIRRCWDRTCWKHVP